MSVSLMAQRTGAIPSITLAHRLRIAREFAHLDQAELAELAGIGRTTVVNYELGHRVPRRLYLRAIAEATGVDIEWLETGEAPPNDEASPDSLSQHSVRPKRLELPTFCLGANMSSSDVFWSADRKSGLLALERQLSVDVESHDSVVVS